MHTEETEQQDLSAIRAVCQAQSFKDLCKLEGINLVKILHETFRENDFTRLIRFLRVDGGITVFGEHALEALAIEFRRLRDLGNAVTLSALLLGACGGPRPRA